MYCQYHLYVFTSLLNMPSACHSVLVIDYIQYKALIKSLYQMYPYIQTTSTKLQKQFYPLQDSVLLMAVPNQFPGRCEYSVNSITSEEEHLLKNI